MNKKVYNIHWIICMSIWIIATAGCAVSFLFEKETAENTLYAFVILAVLFVSLLFKPVCVEFDKKSLTIHFLFGFFQKLNWDTVWKIERQSKPSDIRYYNVFGDSYGKKRFSHHLKFRIIKGYNACYESIGITNFDDIEKPAVNS